jgi:hypothetical protein
MVPVFGVQHDQMKNDRIGRDDGCRKCQVLEQRADVLARVAVAEKIRNLTGKEFRDLQMTAAAITYL